MLVSVQWLVFRVICLNPKKGCEAPAGSDKEILAAAEKCQSSVQDSRLYYWEQKCSITNCTEKLLLLLWF